MDFLGRGGPAATGAGFAGPSKALALVAKMEIDQFEILQQIWRAHEHGFKGVDPLDMPGPQGVAARNAARLQKSHARLDKLRKEKEEEEMKQMQSKPKINSRSRQLASAKRHNRKGTSIAERQTKQRELELQRRDELRKQLSEKELEQVHSPVINNKSRRLKARGVGKMMDWQSRRDERVNTARKEMEQRRQQEMKIRPKLSRGSERILRRMKKQGRTPSVPASERLHNQAGMRDQRREAAVQAAKNLFSHKPRTGRKPRGRRADSDEHDDAGERLYREAEAQRQRREQALQRQLHAQEHDPVTGQDLFSPQINRSSSRNRRAQAHARRAGQQAYRTTPVHERLFQKGVEYDRRLQARQDQRDARFEAELARPKISVNSEDIVHELEHFGAIEGTDERITKSIGAVRQRTLNNIEQPTFRPEIHPAPSQTGGQVRKPAPSPGKIAKHTSALSAEEVTYYRAERARKPAAATAAATTTTNNNSTTKGDNAVARSVPGRVIKASAAVRVADKIIRKKGRSARKCGPGSPRHSLRVSLAHSKTYSPPAAHSPPADALRERVLRRRKAPRSCKRGVQALQPQKQQVRSQTQVSDLVRKRVLQKKRSPNGATERPVRKQQRLPSGWTEYTNDEGYIYFGHTDGRVQWERPVGQILSSPDASTVQRKVHAAGQSFLDRYRASSTAVSLDF